MNLFSQAMDVMSLSKLARQTIINLVMALGFLAHGYATGEFEVTEDRLGVYLPVEHIDNPKGYNEGKDARTVHPALRGPVDPRELQVEISLWRQATARPLIILALCHVTD